MSYDFVNETLCSINVNNSSENTFLSCGLTALSLCWAPEESLAHTISGNPLQSRELSTILGLQERKPNSDAKDLAQGQQKPLLFARPHLPRTSLRLACPESDVLT